MVSGSLALLNFSFEMTFSWFAQGEAGSGPKRGRSPVEWGDFLSVRRYVCTSVDLFVRSSVSQPEA